MGDWPLPTNAFTEEANLHKTALHQSTYNPIMLLDHAEALTGANTCTLRVHVGAKLSQSFSSHCACKHKP